MGLPNYTSAAIRAARLAGFRAARAGAKKVEPEHLLLALLSDVRWIAPILSELKIDASQLKERLRGVLGTVSEKRSKPRLSSRMEKILLLSETEGATLGARSIDVPHLLLAIAHEQGEASKILEARGADYVIVRRAVRAVMHLAPPSRCRECGYDLRATPERCPECGTVV